MNGSEIHNFFITNIANPGKRILKAVIVSGNLESSRTTKFRYATDLPDLIIEFEGFYDNKIHGIVKNGGINSSGDTYLRIYEEQTGALIGEQSVPSLAKEELYLFAMDWTGGSGTFIIKAVIDPSNLVSEYNEENNIERGEIMVGNLAPDCSSAKPSVSTLWPPNHKMQEVSIINITDPKGDAISININMVKQDEATNGAGSGNTCPDAENIGSSAVQLRAERSGQGNGRVYHLYFTATDSKGASCNGEAKVCVPHNQNENCIDEGPLYDSSMCQ